MVTAKSENFYKYSALSMQTEILKTKYWIDGYAICCSDDYYFWMLMPAGLFHFNDNVFKEDVAQPVSDIGTLETIAFLIEIEPRLNTFGFQPVSCTFKTLPSLTEITEVILFHLQSEAYFSVPIAKLHLLTDNVAIPCCKLTTLISPAKLFVEDTINE